MRSELFRLVGSGVQERLSIAVSIVWSLLHALLRSLANLPDLFRIKRLLNMMETPANNRELSFWQRPIPLGAIMLLALAVHGPLLAMQLPLTTSYDANFHIFFASHYAHHWFEPWNPKWFAGFSQTTYPPLAHQWIALFSYVVGLPMAFMLVQLIAILLIPVGVYRFSRLWVSERASSYAALLSIFVGAVPFLVYSAGQLPTTLSAPIYLLALPYFYDWSRSSDMRSLVKGVVLTLTAGAVHHVTLILQWDLRPSPPLGSESCYCPTGWQSFNIRLNRFRFPTPAARTCCSISTTRSIISLCLTVRYCLRFRLCFGSDRRTVVYARWCLDSGLRSCLLWAGPLPFPS
jgi:hypothetical protein